jgi:L-alanine-DL-glutamate epimerase-like enolase superfamily enzyme
VKIVSVTATPVRLAIPSAPYTTIGAGTKIEWGGKRSRIAPKRPGPVLEYVLVRIETDEGLAGVGEAQVDVGFFGETVEQAKAAIED